MSDASRPYQPELLKALRDPTEAAEYLNSALEDGSEEVLVAALRNVAEAMQVPDTTADGAVAHGLRLAKVSATLEKLGFKLAVAAKDTVSV